jgi:transcriptional regulator with XRE-family HTH domain
LTFFYNNPILIKMDISTLKTVAKVKGFNQSELAKLAGVSRQTVSHWFQQDTAELNLHAKNLTRLAGALRVTVDELLKPLPIQPGTQDWKRLQNELLWDRLYPDLESFISGLIRGQSVALARLTQIYGLHQAAKIAGRQVWKKFPKFKNQMAHAPRKAAEVIWNLQKESLKRK